MVWRGYSGREPSSVHLTGAIMMHPLVAQHIPAIQALCRESGVVRLETFDLPLGDEPALLVTFTRGADERGVRRLAEMEERLAAILGQDVTLVTVAALRNEWLREAAWATRSTIYEAPARYPYTSTSTHASSQFGDEPVMFHDHVG